MYPHPLELLQRSLTPAIDALVALIYTCVIVLAVAAMVLTVVAIGTSLIQAWRDDHDPDTPPASSGGNMRTPKEPTGAIPRRTSMGVAIALLTLPGTAPAQVEASYRISQRAAITQHVSSTVIELEYSRPGVRGRSDLFGGPIHWGEVWTPGANEATVLALSDTVKMEGQVVPPGRWSMWMIPSNVGPWELLLHPQDSLFHTQRPDIGADGQIRFPIRTEAGDHVELLTWSFPEVTQTGATLRMAWADVTIPLSIEVDADLPVIAVSDEEAARYLGAWEVTFLRAPDGTPALSLDGKETLAREVARETARGLGIEVEDEEEDEEATSSKKKKKRRAAPELPIVAVYFSTFIIQ